MLCQPFHMVIADETRMFGFFAEGMADSSFGGAEMSAVLHGLTIGCSPE